MSILNSCCSELAVANVSNVYVTVHQDALVAIYKQQQSDEEETEENASNS